MNAAADPVAELLDDIRAGAIASGQFFLMDTNEQEAAFNDDLLAALMLPPSVLVVHMRVTSAEPGDPAYVHTMPWTLGRSPTGGWTSVPDVELARKRGFTEDEIEAALRRATGPQDERARAGASQAAEQPPTQGTAPVQDLSPLPNVINFGSAKRALHPPGIRYENGNPVWIGS